MQMFTASVVWSATCGAWGGLIAAPGACCAACWPSTFTSRFDVSPVCCQLHAGHAEFHGERVVERHLRRLGGIDLLHAQIDSAIRTGRQASLDLFLHKYGVGPVLPAVGTQSRGEGFGGWLGRVGSAQHSMLHTPPPQSNAARACVQAAA